jgi:hypothetical protein
MMNMRINFPDIIKVTVWSTFLSKKLSIRIKHQMKVEFLRQCDKHKSRSLIIIKKNSFSINWDGQWKMYLLVLGDSTDDDIEFWYFQLQ